MQYDPDDEILLADIERIQNANKANNDENFQAKFDVDYMAGVNKDWLIKSRKKTQKSVLSAHTKHDHLRFVRQLEKYFDLDEQRM